MLEKYCYECHGGKKTKGGTDLKKLDGDPAVGKWFELWSKVKEAVQAGEMPPEDDPQLAVAEKERLMKWLGHSLEAAARASAGDPGPVTIRRLTNAEYDHTIRDLTGVDHGYGREFSPDGGGGEGFSNVGDVLFVSPQQLDKYLGAARKLTEHAAVLPGRGILFQEQRVGLRSAIQLHDQAEQALYVWYQKTAGPHIPQDGEDLREADYLLACWKFKYREKTGAVSLDQLAADMKLSSAFLANWWELLNSETPASRFLDLTRVPWRELSGPEEARPGEIPAVVQSAVREIQSQRHSWTNLDKTKGWVSTQRNQQDSDSLRAEEVTNTIREDHPIYLVVGDAGDGPRGDLVRMRKIVILRDGKREAYPAWLRRRAESQRAEIQALAADPAADQTRLAALEKFVADADRILALFGRHPLGLSVEPDTLVLQAPVALTLPFDGAEATVTVAGQIEPSGEDSDFASAQFNVSDETPPDPTKIIPGAIVLWKSRTATVRRVMADFDRMKIAFPDEFARRLEEVARNFRVKDGKTNGKSVYYLSDAQLNALLPQEERDRHERMLKDWRILSPTQPSADLQKEWDDALQSHLQHFAEKAWRRPISDEEKALLGGVYTAALARGLDRESAAREGLMRIFIAPDFLFKLEKAEQPGIRPVNAWELAVRISYFLWSSMPDDELRRVADDGSLLKLEVLEAQIRRMLASKNSEALAEEFAGQWLKFHGFSKHSTVEAGKFPEFTGDLRADMHRESREFFKYIVREDRPVQEILLADYTFLNERLAKHYGIPGVTGDDFRKVSVAPYHRGGLLGMGSVLTKTSFPQRTSPVLRGNWLLHDVLGLPTPPPPADVPPFPEVTEKAMTVRQKLEAHRADKACASCHDKIDPLGFALEGFDAIGRFREKDESGLAIDDSGSLKDGSSFRGLDGLRGYLATRDREFNELFARKLIGYSLGRSIMPSDQILISSISDALKKSGGTFSAAVVAIVQSKQFRYRRNE